MAPGVSPDAVKDTLVLPWDLTKSLEIIEANADSLATVLVEPVQSRRPGLHPREFLRALRDLTARRGMPLIFDEMITGFRLPPGGAKAIFGEEHVPLNIVNFGSLMRFNVAGNFTYLYQPPEMDLFCHHLIERGIYIWEGRTLFLSTEHTTDDLDTIRRAVRESVREMKAGGFFAGPSTRLPLTEAQRDLWVLAQMGTDGANAYQETIA